MKKKVNRLTIILILVIIILSCILSYGVYTGLKIKSIIASFQSQISQLTSEKEDLRVELDSLHNRYVLLEQDVAKIYKTCMRENECRGHFPLVSWYCNNVGDDADYPDASHICVCDNKCDLTVSEIKK